MPWIPQEKEIATLWKEIPEHRYAYCLHHWVDEEVLWTLEDKDWALLRTEEGEEVMPLWPHEVYAQKYAVGPWASHRPRVITLKAWLEAWSPGLQNQHRRLGIFPTPEGKDLVITPRDLAEALAAEMAKY